MKLYFLIMDVITIDNEATIPVVIMIFLLGIISGVISRPLLPPFGLPLPSLPSVLVIVATGLLVVATALVIKIIHSY